MATEYARKLLGVGRERPPPPPSARISYRSRGASNARHRPNVYNRSLAAYEGAGKAYVPKSPATKSFLARAIAGHYLFADLTNREVNEVVDAMTMKLAHRADSIILEGTDGDVFYVLESGTCDVVVNGKRVKEVKPGDCFGELALLYTAPRAASVMATSVCTLWALDRSAFRRTIQSTKSGQMSAICSFLKHVPQFSSLSNHEISTIAGVLGVGEFDRGTNIVEQGEAGDKFYIILSGKCNVFSTANGTRVDVNTLTAGDFFGEAALMTKEPRNATVQVTSLVAEILSVDKSSFELVLGPLSDRLEDVHRKRLFDTTTAIEKVLSLKGADESGTKGQDRQGTSSKAHDLNIEWEDLKQHRTLGTGTFGRVKLMEHRTTGRAMALKCMQKHAIVQAHQEVNIVSERDVMLACDHPFIIKLYRTFQDANSVFMLLELVQGGELWTLLYQNQTALPRTKLGGIQSTAAKFYAACVVSCFEHIHGLGVAYRDLKPENLLLDANGYLKMVDFGFAKKVPFMHKLVQRNKTFTLCGTPEYLSPEIIQSRGHDQGVDWWATGVLIYELITGETPFCDPSQKRIFQNILKSQTSLKFTPVWDRDAVDLVRRLLHPDSARRLGMIHGGAQTVKKHAWFQTLEWAKHVRFENPAPYVPVLNGALDTSMFDPYPEEDPIMPFRGTNEVFKSF